MSLMVVLKWVLFIAAGVVALEILIPIIWALIVAALVTALIVIGGAFLGFCAILEKLVGRKS